MKRFAYPMEALRRYRGFLIDQARADLVDAERARLKTEHELERLRLAAKEANGDPRLTASGPDLLWSRLQNERFMTSLRRRETLQQSLLAKAIREQDFKLQALTRARQAKQQLDSHRDRQHEVWARDLRRWEEKQTDEAGAGRFIRQNHDPNTPGNAS